MSIDLSTKSVKEKETKITLQEAARHNNSIAENETQGYHKCDYKTKCTNKRCARQAAKKNFYWKYHSSFTFEYDFMIITHGFDDFNNILKNEIIFFLV